MLRKGFFFIHGFFITSLAVVSENRGFFSMVLLPDRYSKGAGCVPESKDWNKSTAARGGSINGTAFHRLIIGPGLSRVLRCRRQSGPSPLIAELSQMLTLSIRPLPGPPTRQGGTVVLKPLRKANCKTVRENLDEQGRLPCRAQISYRRAERPASENVGLPMCLAFHACDRIIERQQSSPHTHGSRRP